MAQAHDHERTVIVRPASESTLRPGTKILNDTYVIEAVLGQGGMGEVYKAEHIELGAKRAIKIIIPQFAQDPQYVKLFIEEARKLSNVNNDAIVRYYEFSRDEAGARYLVMEFVDGDALATALKTERFSPPEVIRLLERVGYGLSAAYAHGIKAHRDLSPGNIILPQRQVELAKVIDFGIAKADVGRDPTVLADGAGKEQFKSPEQNGMFGGAAEVDQRSDIYSLGLVLAAASMGKQLDMGTDMASRYLARQSVPEMKEVPPKLRPILGWMLEPHPEKRPQTMRELLDEIERMTAVPTRLGGSFAASQPDASGAAPSRPGGSAPRLPAFDISPERKISPRLLAIAGAGAVAVIAVAAGGFFALRPSAPSPDNVRAEIAATVTGYLCADLSYSVGPDRVATLSGYVASADDLKQLAQRVDSVHGIAGSHMDVKLRPWPYCEAASVLKPLIASAGASAAGLTFASADAMARIGSPLALDIRAPGFDGYAYVDYYNADGDVLHLFPNDNDALNFRPARNGFVLGRPPQVGMHGCWTLSGDTGEQLVTYIASSEPLFTKPRPAQEHAKDYLAALSHVVSGDGKQAAKLLFFDLHAADADRREQPCSN
jgi:predicted Ser/Thr protein kinase